LRKDFDGVGDAYGAEIREMHEDGLTGWRPLGALRGIWLARVEIAIDEIRDDFDGPLDVKFADGLLLQIV
jgi:hypothetical protein